MQITIHKKYIYTDGTPARILCTDVPGTEFPILSMDTYGGLYYHKADGKNLHKTANRDLVEVWEPEDKEPIWCWDSNSTMGRHLKFWDKQNNSTFGYEGFRKGATYDNYAKVEHIEQWMLDAQAKL